MMFDVCFSVTRAVQVCFCCNSFGKYNAPSLLSASVKKMASERPFASFFSFEVYTVFTQARVRKYTEIYAHLTFRSRLRASEIRDLVVCLVYLWGS